MIRLRPCLVLLALLPLGPPSARCRGEGHETAILGEGRPWQTPYYLHDTGVPGPTVLVIGGIHGNEPAGFRAAEQIRHWPVVRGKLVVLPRANTLGLNERTRYIPGAPRKARDLNRDFPGDEFAKGAPKGEIAAALWMLVLQRKPDWIFDLHEGYAFHVSHDPPEGAKKSVGSSIIYRPGHGTEPLVRRMWDAANATVTDPDRRFALLDGGPVETGVVSAASRRLGVRGMILETTFKDQRLSVRTHQHRTMMSVALRHLGLIDRDCSNVMVPERTGERLAVGLFDDDGASERGVRNVIRALGPAPDITVVRLRAADLRPNTLAQFDAVVFGGGSGSQQAETIGTSGADAIRTFVRDGGGFVGLSAGAFLSSAQYEWSLDLIDTRVLTGTVAVEGQPRVPLWDRGAAADVGMQLTEAGREIFADVPELVQVRYHNGPIVAPRPHEGLESYEPLAYFRSEQVLHPPQQGTMVDTPAIVRGRFGAGHVIAIAPQPEATPGLESMLESALRAVARPATPTEPTMNTK